MSENCRTVRELLESILDKDAETLTDTPMNQSGAMINSAMLIAAAILELKEEFRDWSKRQIN